MREQATSVSGPAQAAFAAGDRARRIGAPGLRALLAWQIARIVLRLCLLGVAAVAVGGLVMGGEPGWSVVTALPVLLLATTLAGVGAERCQIAAETGVATALRADVSGLLCRADAATLRALPVGELTVALQRHPPALAALVTSHRAATLMMAAGPLMAAAALVVVSWQAAALMLVLTPLMIVFFALVGQTIRSRADAQERAFGKLAGQFADRIRTLPTILANDALDTERGKLARRLGNYADNTMSVLRIAFVNAAIIDFFASLSIAMLAVFLGLGHLGLADIPGFAGLELWQSLFILMIAPDYFAPFRRFSEQYHAKAEGLAAAEALDRLLDFRAVPVTIAQVESALAGFELPARGLVAVTGASGSGKSTFLRHLAGIEGDGARDPRGYDWISTDSPVRGGRLGAAIAWNGTDIAPSRLMMAAGRVGLLDDDLLPGGLNATISEGGANLSGGQRLRVAIARALLSHRPVIADEPTAKLDAATAATIRALLREIAGTRAVVVATHDPQLAAMADSRIALDAPDRQKVQP